MSLKGAKQLINRLRRIRAKVPRKIEETMLGQAVELQARAIAVAPELSRRLVQSSRVTREARSNRVAIGVSFDTPYAVIRHEDFYNPGLLSRAKSPTQDGDAGRKYLERPYNNMLEQIQEKIGEAVVDACREEGAE